MTIIATCGHQLESHEGPDGMGHSVAVRSWARDNSRAVSFRTVCNACKTTMTEAGVIFLSQAEEDGWLRGDGPDDQPAW